MHLILDLKLLLLLAAANGAPVLAHGILGVRGSYPIDCKAVLADGQPLLGAAKTVRGVIFSLIATAAAATLLIDSWILGLIIAASAMLGDILSSFTKRRLKSEVSSMALGIDQIPESLLPALAMIGPLGLSLSDVAIVCLSFFVSELVLSRVLFHLHLRERPY